MGAVKARKMDAYRQSGSDMDGLFEGMGGGAESGRAKAVRFGTTEQRILVKFASKLEEFHTSILELASRRMDASVPRADERVFMGTVQYPQTFEVAESGTLIEEYNEIKDPLAKASPTWNRLALTRIALASIGETSKANQTIIKKEIGDFDMPEPTPPPPGLTMTGGNGFMPASREEMLTNPNDEATNA